MPPFLSGSLMKESNIQVLETQNKKQKIENEVKSEKSQAKRKGKTLSKPKGKTPVRIRVRIGPPHPMCVVRGD